MACYVLLWRVTVVVRHDIRGYWDNAIEIRYDYKYWKFIQDGPPGQQANYLSVRMRGDGDGFADYVSVGPARRGPNLRRARFYGRGCVHFIQNQEGDHWVGQDGRDNPHPASGPKSKEERNLGMAQIQKVLLRKLIQTHTMRSSSGRGFASTSSTTTYHQFILVFVTDQNEEIPFDFGKVRVGLMNMLTSPEEKIRRNAQEVANFLNVPMDAATPSASDVIGAIRAGIAGRFQKVHWHGLQPGRVGSFHSI
jgi:hypothetical protein